jgi:nitrite reductase/ring-hydroxylating ferredoxin subunit
MEPGSVRKFWLDLSKYRVDAFHQLRRQIPCAYVNRCRHMTTPLDFVRNHFFTEDGRHLECLTHGAIYEPESGLCVEGPCKGLALYRLPVMIDREEVLVSCPTGDLSFLEE